MSADPPGPGDVIYCQNCGQQLLETANFCDRCGAEVPDQSGAESSTTQEETTPTEDETAESGPPEEDDTPIYVPETDQRDDRDGTGNSAGSSSDGQIDESARAVPGYYSHLFGDVYWDKRTRHDIPQLIGVALLLLPGDILREPVLWLLEMDPSLAFWVLRNLRGIGLFLIVAGVAGRVTIGPEKVKQGAGEREEEEGEPSFFTLYWLPGFSK